MYQTGVRYVTAALDAWVGVYYDRSWSVSTPGLDVGHPEGGGGGGGGGDGAGCRTTETEWLRNPALRGHVLLPEASQRDTAEMC